MYGLYVELTHGDLAVMQMLGDPDQLVFLVSDEVSLTEDYMFVVPLAALQEFLEVLRAASKSSPKVQTAGDTGYLKFNLTEDDRASIRQWANSAEDLWEKIAQLLDSQYQFKVSYDKNNDCYACYISGHWMLNKPDAGWTLTGRGSSWEKAVRQALWVHFEHFGGDWQQAKRSNPVSKDWD